MVSWCKWYCYLGKLNNKSSVVLTGSDKPAKVSEILWNWKLLDRCSQLWIRLRPLVVMSWPRYYTCHLYEVAHAWLQLQSQQLHIFQVCVNDVGVHDKRPTHRWCILWWNRALLQGWGPSMIVSLTAETLRVHLWDRRTLLWTCLALGMLQRLSSL